MKRIGLTGGIGSGKSFIANILEHMGFPVYYSDSRSKELTKSNPTIRMGLISLFGEDVFIDGQLNTQLVSTKIFQNEEYRQKVNELIHPIVRKDFEDWAMNQNSNLVFNEAAILFETGAFKNFDATILVCAPLELKIQRVMKRENCSEEEVLARMRKQWSDEEKRKLADFVIENDEKQPIVSQIENALNRLINNFN
ncbi:MAG: dephospho-CoA kinase [Bacteroidetes bacterium]|nr:dephospho-CoA kinase [Bacteroidota bacterium]